MRDRSIAELLLLYGKELIGARHLAITLRYMFKTNGFDGILKGIEELAGNDAQAIYTILSTLDLGYENGGINNHHNILMNEMNKKGAAAMT